jgi:hypothetical protein
LWMQEMSCPHCDLEFHKTSFPSAIHHIYHLVTYLKQALPPAMWILARKIKTLCLEALQREFFLFYNKSFAIFGAILTSSCHVTFQIFSCSGITSYKNCVFLVYEVCSKSLWTSCKVTLP